MVSLRVIAFAAVCGKAASFDCSFEDSYPKQYVVHKTSQKPVIDGKLDEPMWKDAQWTDEFLDISQPSITTKPRFYTRAKMRWDDDYLYVGAYLEEQDIWANITETCHCCAPITDTCRTGTNETQNQVIFHDNDFEIFVDADGDNHYYYEYEVNALNAIWNLCLNKPYNDDGGENSTRVFGSEGWDFPPWSSASPGAPPMLSKVHVEGTVNQPGALDKFWSVEVAIPLKSLVLNNSAQVPPRHGQYWRINFSRVEWKVEVVDGKYQKVPRGCDWNIQDDCQHEDNWVWSPQGEIAMHLPERWGFLQFSTAEQVGTTAAVPNAEWPIRQVAMELYHAQHAFAKQNNGSFTSSLNDLIPFATAGVLECAQPAVLNVIAVESPEGVNCSDSHYAFRAVINTLDGSMAASITDDRLLRVSYPIAAPATPPALFSLNGAQTAGVVVGSVVGGAAVGAALFGGAGQAGSLMQRLHGATGSTSAAAAVDGPKQRVGEAGSLPESLLGADHEGEAYAMASDSHRAL
jgi:hypothetical protein